MYYVYLLKSVNHGWSYIGSTNDLKERFIMHNKGLIRSTKFYKPFILVYYEAYLNEKDARKREKNLKLKSRAFIQLRKRLKYSLGVRVYHYE